MGCLQADIKLINDGLTASVELLNAPLVCKVTRIGGLTAEASLICAIGVVLDSYLLTENGYIITSEDGVRIAI